LNPRIYRFSRGGRDLKLHRLFRFVLHHHGARFDLAAMADISNPQGYKVASSQFAVKTEIEQRKLSDPKLHLQSHPDGPDVFGFQWSLLANQFALVPGFAAAGCGFIAHHGLLKKDGRHRLSIRARAIPGTDWIHDCGQNKPATGVTQHNQNAERPVEIQLESLHQRISFWPMAATWHWGWFANVEVNDGNRCKVDFRRISVIR
jgi:hypothetical protein